MHRRRIYLCSRKSSPRVTATANVVGSRFEHVSSATPMVGEEVEEGRHGLSGFRRFCAS